MLPVTAAAAATLCSQRIGMPHVPDVFTLGMSPSS